MNGIAYPLITTALAVALAAPVAAQTNDGGWWIPASVPTSQARPASPRGRAPAPRQAARAGGRRDRNGAHGRADDDSYGGTGRRDGGYARDDRDGDEGGYAHRDRDDDYGSAYGYPSAGAYRNDGSGAGQARRGNGPPFCRDGRGHPTKGMEWCAEKGWAPGYSSYGWSRASWPDVILGRIPLLSGSRLGGPSLLDVLGRVVLGRLVNRARYLGATGGLEGRWLDLGARGRVLQLRAGGRPLAELADLNRDGRADRILLAAGR